MRVFTARSLSAYAGTRTTGGGISNVLTLNWDEGAQEHSGSTMTLANPSKSRLIALGVAALLGGCANLGYYAQAVNGHSSIHNRSGPFTRSLPIPRPIRG